jgi:hypothetical protein
MDVISLDYSGSLLDDDGPGDSLQRRSDLGGRVPMNRMIWMMTGACVSGYGVKTDVKATKICSPCFRVSKEGFPRYGMAYIDGLGVSMVSTSGPWHRVVIQMILHCSESVNLGVSLLYVLLLGVSLSQKVRV